MLAPRRDKGARWMTPRDGPKNRRRVLQTFSNFDNVGPFQIFRGDPNRVIVLQVWRSAANAAEISAVPPKPREARCTGEEVGGLGLKGRSTAQILSPQPDGFSAVRSIGSSAEINGADPFAPEAARRLAQGCAADANRGG